MREGLKTSIKPTQEAYEALLRAITLLANEIVFIDDKLENIEGAKQMGFDAILFESAAATGFAPN